MLVEPLDGPQGKIVTQLTRILPQCVRALMHKGKVDTQDENGTEIWVFDTERRKRVARLELPVEASNILSSQEPAPRLYVYDKDSKLHIYDGHRLRLLRTIEKPGVNARLLQTLTQYD